MTMTPDAKRALATTIRGLRARLLADLRASTESAYRLSAKAHLAGLDDATRRRRERLEAWAEEQRRAQIPGKGAKGGARSTEDFLREAEKQAAYTLLNRVVVLRLLEAPIGPDGKPLRAPALVTGGWESRAYKDFRALAPELARGDETEGYAFLLRLVFEDLAADLPGIFGPAGVADLIPVSAATLRHLVEQLDDDALASCWTDDMTLGWVYQYWNDPEREALDAKIAGGGKIEPHEIASKTQMFTERYMVDWLLQNSLGPLWLSMCKKHGWVPEVEADGTLARLEERRAEWRGKRERGEVALTDLMPLHTESERRWAYYVTQPTPEDAVANAPESVRAVTLLDPAVGSGHFLVVAVDLLAALYREEARHRGEAGRPEWSERAIVERILEANLHGVDLDPRAVQIAAASLWMKGRTIARDAHPRTLNLVASNLRLASLQHDDAALVELRREVERETGIPGALTDTILQALRGADHLGSLLKVNEAVNDAIAKHEGVLGARPAEQGSLFGGFSEERPKPKKALDAEGAKAAFLTKLESFLSNHTSGEDLGLRLRGEQLSAGVRFLRIVREGTYDLVVANPPYQGTAKMAEAKYLEQHYALGKADLYAAFLLRGLELVREGGTSAMLTMRNWMFIKQYAGLREHLLGTQDLRAIGDFEIGAFEEIGGMVVSVCVSVFRRASQCGVSIAQKLTAGDDGSNAERTVRKRAATLCHVGRHDFDPAAQKVVPEWPLVYWWDAETLQHYRERPLLGSVAPLKLGVQTSNASRFERQPWEPDRGALVLDVASSSPVTFANAWVPYIKGAAGLVWLEPLRFLLNWSFRGLELKVLKDAQYGNYARHIQSEGRFFSAGVACSPIGASFSARAHTYPSIIDNMGLSVFCEHAAQFVALLNASRSRRILESLNPTVHFTSGDVNRLPLFELANATAVFRALTDAFAIHESHREPSVEFKRPGPSPWRHAQEWAQLAVDRPEGAPLPDYVETLDPEPHTDHVSFALGVALGRFGAKGEGLLDPSKDDVSHALPAGILFLDTTLDDDDAKDDSLAHPACALLEEAWSRHGAAIAPKRSLRAYLALDFFKDVHKGMYESRPIHWPLSSAGRTFVAWVNIHRMNEGTLRTLLADHLHPALARLDAQLGTLRAARDGADKKASRDAEKRLDKLLAAKDELAAFIASVDACANQGPPPTDPKCPPRERDARYEPDLDDGVMVNSAALWPLLDPQWKDPKKWWKELACAQGKKDYDWSHLAMRYWPTRVDAKCKQDPSLGVAHGCFWRYHPERAWAWELRLQDEIAADFRIEEKPYRPGGDDVGDAGDAPHREAWLREHAAKSLEAVEKEAVRRMGRGSKQKAVPELRILERGLWSALPAEVWAMELRLSEKQGVEFRLLSPDEPEARAAFEAANPAKASERRSLMSTLVPRLVATADDANDDDLADAGAGDEDDAEQEDA
jgi:hypothetical protein